MRRSLRALPRAVVVALVVPLVIPVAALSLVVPRADAAGLTNVTAPTITGTAQVGEALTAQPGSWTPAPTAYAYHWLRDGQPIPNATGPTYEPGPNDVGHPLTVQVDASDTVGDTGTATSAPTAAVAQGEIAAKGGQKIVGVTRYTHTLTVHPGRFSVATTDVLYQWFSGDRPIAGATGQSYAIQPQDVGTRLSVIIAPHAPGYALGKFRTKPTPAIGYRIDVRRKVTYSVQTRGRITTSVAQFEALAQQTYDDARGWRSAGIQFTRVAHGGSFTLVLAAAASVPSFSSECSTMWSCRVGRYVIINQDRWEHASPAWNAAHLSLRDYRNLVVNHETGHWLGLHDIYSCPTPGKPAPVMMEQSKGIGSCHFNPWPLAREIASRTPHARSSGSERVMVAAGREGYARVESD